MDSATASTQHYKTYTEAKMSWYLIICQESGRKAVTHHGTLLGLDQNHKFAEFKEAVNLVSVVNFGVSITVHVCSTFVSISTNF